MRPLTSLIIFAAFIFSGCASIPSEYPAEVHEAAKRIELYEEEKAPAKNYTTIKEVASNSCDSKTAVRISGDMEEAKLLLKLEAAKAKADAVVNYTCWTSPIDLVSNCWAAKKCKGIAIKF